MQSLYFVKRIVHPKIIKWKSQIFHIIHSIYSYIINPGDILMWEQTDTNKVKACAHNETLISVLMPCMWCVISRIISWHSTTYECFFFCQHQFLFETELRDQMWRKKKLEPIGLGPELLDCRKHPLKFPWKPMSRCPMTW